MMSKAIWERMVRNRLWSVGAICLFGLAMVLPGSPSSVAMAADEPAAIVFEPNITYATVGTIALQLDLAHPKQIVPAKPNGPERLLPCLVFIHGGGWSGGNRHAFRQKVEEAARKGYVAATISYRLTDPNPSTQKAKWPHPAQVHDCKAAIRWLRAHAVDYQIDPNRIAAIGASAGGHLSLMVGLTDANDQLEGAGGNLDQSSRVQAVVNIFGPTDLLLAYETSPGAIGFLKPFCGGTPDEARDNYVSASPVTYVTEDDPPVLTLHGEADKLVPPGQATLLDERMKAAKAEHVLKLYPEQGHGFVGEAAADVDQSIWTFLAEKLKP
jgi:acetyl esterase/lipase